MSNFEEHIRRKLGHYPSEVDTNALWESIKEDIPKEEDKKKRVIFFFWLFGLGLFGGMASWWLYQNNGTQLANQVHTDKEYSQDNPQETNLGHHVSGADEALESFLENEIPFSNKNKLVSHTETSLLNTESAKGNWNVNFNKDHFLPHSTTLGHIPTITSIKSSEPILVSSIPTKKVALASLEVVSTEKKEETEEDMDAIPYLLAVLAEEKEIDDLENELSPDAFEEEANIKVDNHKKLKLQAGFHVTYGASNSIIYAKSDTYDDYAELRRNTERAISTVELGVDFNILFKNGLTMRTGLTHTRIKEKMKYTITPNSIPGYHQGNNDLEGKETSSAWSGSSNDPNTNSSGNNGSPQTSNNPIKFNHDNLYTMTDIPLVMGYQQAIGKRVGIQFEAGTYINLYSSASGFIVHPNTKIYKLDLGEIRSHKNNILLSTYTGLNLNYQASSKLALRVGAHYRFTPFSITGKNYSLNQKYATYGLHAGMAFTIK